MLLVNAWPGHQSNLLCAPGGGVELHQSLPENLKREIFEETGLEVEVGDAVLINEFHDPEREFHQVDVYFRCTLLSIGIPADWTDPEGIVHTRKWVTREELAVLNVKPDSLAEVVWDHDGSAAYDPLEPIVR